MAKWNDRQMSNPSGDAPVLVAINGDIIRTGFYRHGEWNVHTGVYISGTESKKYKVTGWAELPKLPKDDASLPWVDAGTKQSRNRETVLVALACGHVRAGFFENGYWYYYNSIFGGQFAAGYDKVTHWMYPPEIKT